MSLSVSLTNWPLLKGDFAFYIERIMYPFLLRPKDVELGRLRQLEWFRTVGRQCVERELRSM